MYGGKSNNTTRPTILGLMTQSSVYGRTIPRIYGRAKVTPSVIWANGLREGPTGKKGKKAGKKGAPPTYVCNADFLLGLNPIMQTLRWWGNASSKYDLVFTSHNFTPSGTRNQTLDMSFDPLFYAVIGVSATTSGSLTASFSDYGAPASTTFTGQQEIPLWNSAQSGPDPTNNSSSRYWPFNYRWNPGDTTILIENGDEISALGGWTGSFNSIWPSGHFTVYYAQLISSSLGAPISQLRLAFEAVLGSGSEYTGYSAQQIQYPMYAGAGSSDVDLGSGPAFPQFRAEVIGTHPYWSTGDSDLADIIEDTLKMGQSQAALGNTAYSFLHYGTSSSDYPGAVQKKIAGDLEWFEYSNLPFDRPNTAGNIIIAAINDSLANPTISDTQGNAYTQLFSGASTDTVQVAYATNIAASLNNKVQSSDHGFSWEFIAAEFADLDTVDFTDMLDHGLTGDHTFTFTTTQADGQPAYVWLWMNTASNISLVGQDAALWKPFFGGYTKTADPIGRISCYYRIFRTPGTYSITMRLTAGSFSAAIIGLKNSNPQAFPKPLGNIVDEDSMLLCRNQAQAFGLKGSLVTDSQRAASEWLTDLYQGMNSWPVWSGFKLKSVPMSEASYAGNGMMYLSPTAAGPVAQLTSSDFIDGEVTQIERRDPLDSQNVIQFQHPDRSNDYNPAVVTEPDNGGIQQLGRRSKDLKQMLCIQDTQVARMLLGVAVRRSVYLRNAYTFSLRPKWNLLEAGDLVGITDEFLGLNQFPVRLTKVKETPEHKLDCEAEEFIYGLSAPALLPTTANAGNSINTQGTPAAPNAPIIFEPPTRITASGQNELWIVVSDVDPTYGGCIVNLSIDGGTTYQVVGQTVGNPAMGVTAGSFPANVDPDTTNDLPVDLTTSLGTLATFNTTEEDSFQFLCYVDDTTAYPTTSVYPFELIAYGVAQLTGTNLYTLKATGGGNKLRRGVYGTWKAAAGVAVPNNGPAHSSGVKFCYLDPSGIGILKLKVDPKWTGKTLHIKLQQFNQFFSSAADISTATDYTYTVLGIAGPAGGGGSTGSGGGTTGGTGGSTSSTYSINPAQPLTNPSSTQIALAQTVATFSPSGLQTNYNARTFTISDPGSTPTTYYVTVYDPALTGDTGTGTTLTAYCTATLAGSHVGEPGYIYMGSIVAIHLGGGTASGGGSLPSTSPIVIGFGVNTGATGTDVCNRVPATRGGTLTKMVAVITASDASTDCTLVIKRNGTNIFTSNPVLTHGAAAGTEVSFTGLTPSPFNVAAGDVFSIDITTGTSAWKFTVTLE